MSLILPMYPLSQFARSPQKALMLCEPYTVLTSHNKEKAVLVKPEIFAQLQKTEVWKEICEEWWELHDEETCRVVKKGKKMVKDGKYINAKV